MSFCSRLISLANWIIKTTRMMPKNNDCNAMKMMKTSFDFGGIRCGLKQEPDTGNNQEEQNNCSDNHADHDEALSLKLFRW